jgi:predicted solute-binding protein
MDYDNYRNKKFKAIETARNDIHAGVQSIKEAIERKSIMEYYFKSLEYHTKNNDQAGIDSVMKKLEEWEKNVSLPTVTFPIHPGNTTDDSSTEDNSD